MSNKVDDQRLAQICKMGQGEDCCRYLLVHPDDGIICAKLTDWAPIIDARVYQMNAKSDNCAGLEPSEKGG